MSIRVMLCDDQALVTDGIQMILETDSALKVVGVARDGVQAVELTGQCKPDIVLMDLKMPGMNGVHATRAIRRDHPETPVLVLTTFDGDDWVMDAIRAGASGYLLKDTPREQLINAVKDTVAGKAFVDPTVAGRLLDRLANTPVQNESSTLIATLTERERDMLTLMTHGLTYGEIAKRMFLSEGTVRNYASAIFTKLNVSDRMQAVVLAMRFGL
jgi:two-component system, NarL family, response regulator LiaR